MSTNHLQEHELAARLASPAFLLGNELCGFDARGCCRRNVDHWLATAHPVGRTRPRCAHLLALRPCPHMARPCPDRAAAAAHFADFTHCPSITDLERVARGEAVGEAPTAKRQCLPASMHTTTTTTTTITTTTFASASAASAPGRVRGGGKLRADFVCPPFSVLDAGQGSWQTRKREWLELGIDSGDGRDDALLGAGLAALTPGLTGTSIFDPVLAECAYKWFCPRPTKGGPPVLVVDPFAGGSCRGIVASKLGLLYVGTDVSARQVKANRAQVATVCADCEHQPMWIIGDGEDVAEHLATALAELGLSANTRADFLLTCPPYYNLEQYGGGPDDLSMLPTYDAFVRKYERIVRSATKLLKPQRVAVFVVGNVRDAKGGLLDLHGDTKRLLGDAGNVLYSDAVLKTALASAPARAGRQMRAASKPAGVHQNVVVTCKGSALDAAACRRIGIQAAD